MMQIHTLQTVNFFTPLHHRRRHVAAFHLSPTTPTSTANKNPLIQSLCKKGKLKQAIHLLSREPYPTRHTYELLIQSCARNRSHSDASAVHRSITENRFHHDPFLATKLIGMYAELGSIQDARKVFDEITQRTVHVWNAIFRALSLYGCEEEVLRLYRRMNQIGMPSDRFTYTYTIKACKLCSAWMGKEIHAHVLRHGYESHVHIMAALIDMYAKYGCVENARLVFSSMPVKNLVSWTTMMTCFAKNGRHLEALELFNEMMLENGDMFPDSVAMQSFCMALGIKKEHKGHGELLEFDKTGKSAYDKVEDYQFPPLVGALKASAEENAASFHFPGHNRGQAAPSSFAHLIGTKPFQHDLPELPELDNLFAPEGPILEAQKQAAKVFGASETWFLVGGSTCGVQAAIMATCSPGDVLILPRNSHVSAISAMVLTGVVPKYIFPEYIPEWDIACGVTPTQVAEAINELQMQGVKPAAVLVVSPSYHGICSDISAIALLCHEKKIPVIVDEAHGAHLSFHSELPISALAQGADIVVQSTHKVLCSLTQSSMLHISGCTLVDREKICRCLQTLQSSSPSYLLLASLDAATAQLRDNQGSAFDESIELAVETRSAINEIPGISVIDISNFPKFPAIDPLRVTVGMQQLGLSGYEADDILYTEFGVVSELVGTQSITFAFNLGTKREHVSRLLLGLKHVAESYPPSDKSSAKTATDETNTAVFDCVKMILSPRDAFFSRKRKVSIEDSVGEICGELICPYPPGIPVMVPGEVITERALKYLMHVRSKGATISGAADHLLYSIVVCDA